MADFNPQVAQGRDDMPSWLKSSAPISDLQVDKSGGIAWSTAATGLEQAAGLAKQTAEDVIGKDVRDTVEPIRNDFTKELELARNAQTSSVVPAPAQSGTGATADLYMSSQPKQAVPDAIDAGVSKVQALQSALANGKINDTYYDLRLKSAVTQLRSTYPGFTDYIDQKVSSITGVNPANAYINNLMQDINRAQTTKKSAVDTAVDTAMKSGYPQSGAMIQRLQSEGETFLPKFQQWYSQNTELDASIKRKDALRKDAQGDKAEVGEQRKADWTNEVGSNVATNLSSMVKIAGLDQPQNILKMVEDGAANPDKYTEAQYKQLGTQLLAQKAVLERQLTARMNQTSKDSQGRTYSYASDVGSEQAASTIKSQLGIYDTMADALINKKDASLAFWAANHSQAILDQSKDNLLSNETIGNFSAKMSNFNELYGPNWTNLVTTSALRKNIDTRMGAYLDNDMLDARLGTNSVTMKQHLESVDKLQKQDKISVGMKSRYIGNLVNIVDDIKNPNAPDSDKANVIKYIFSPEGQGILRHIKTDYTDPNTGKPVTGKYSVFQRLTSDDVVKEVGRLSKSDPSIGKMYKNYLENEAGSQLFYKEMQNLNQFTGHDDLHFKYNTGSGNGPPQIELIPPKNTPAPGPAGLAPQAPASQGYLFQVQKIVNRVNDGLAGMSRVENGLGGNPNEYILQFLQRSQVDLGKNWEGLPGKLVDAIAASRSPQRRIEDTFSNLKK